MSDTIQTILIADDDPHISLLISKVFRDEYEVLTVENGEAALKAIKTRVIDLILLDQKMGDMDGLEILKSIKEFDNNIPVIMITGYGAIELSVKAIKLGAYDYIEKPFDPEKLRIAAAHAVKMRGLCKEVEQLRSELVERYRFQNIISKSPLIEKTCQLISRIAFKDISVLITGESGTGKELAARAIHYSGNRSDKPFVPINCAAIPDNLLESELFGYEKGAFSGADSLKKGKIEIANGGTLFLDEVGDMSEQTQAKLLRFLQDGRFERVGGVTPIQVNVRVISATNKDIEKLMKEKRFRQDLYYRINGVQIELPPLASRIEDIPLLVKHFIKKFNPSCEDKIKGIEPEAMELLLNYSWPGNVRELENTIQTAMALSFGKFITASSLPKGIRDFQRSNLHVKEEAMSLDCAVEQAEISRIKDALERAGNNRTHAAKLLEISLRNLQYKMKKYGIKE